MEQTLLWGYALAVLGALAGGVTLLMRKHRSSGLGLIFVGAVLVVAPAGLIWWSLSPLSDATSIQVEPLDPPNDPWFAVEMRHDRTFDDGIAVWFSASGGPAHVVSVFQEQHPTGVSTLNLDVVADATSQSIWHLSTDDVRYDLTHGPEFDGYALTSQLVVVSPESGGPGARIAFPRTALEVTEVREGQPVANYWTTEQWAAFYDDIGDVQVSGATITVPTNRDYTATITLTDGEAVVALDD